MIFGSLNDEKQKTRYRGHIIDLRTNEIICYVYGKTLEKMRERKHKIRELFYKEYIAPYTKGIDDE